jgi:hypothetical protein
MRHPPLWDPPLLAAIAASATCWLVIALGSCRHVS